MQAPGLVPGQGYQSEAPLVAPGSVPLLWLPVEAPVLPVSTAREAPEVPSFYRLCYHATMVNSIILKTRVHDKVKAMRTWAFVSQKGGVGKSSLATNLAVIAEKSGETCCIVDVDPQANALLWAERRGTNAPMVLEATYEKLADVVEAAATIGVTLTMIDTPGKVDAGALAAMKIADTIVCPTLGDLFSLGSCEFLSRLLSDR